MVFTFTELAPPHTPLCIRTAYTGEYVPKEGFRTVVILRQFHRKNGETLEYRYDTKTEKASLVWGDGDVTTAFDVKHGEAKGINLSKVERTWLRIEDDLARNGK